MCRVGTPIVGHLLVQCVRAWETPCPPLVNPFAPEPLASTNAYPVYDVPEPEEIQMAIPLDLDP